MATDSSKFVRLSSSIHFRLTAHSKRLSDLVSEHGQVRAEVTLASVVDAALNALEATEQNRRALIEAKAFLDGESQVDGAEGQTLAHRYDRDMRAVIDAVRTEGIRDGLERAAKIVEGSEHPFESHRCAGSIRAEIARTIR